MKMSALILGISVALTLAFYLLAYFFLPPPPPSASMMVLFAGIAIAVVWLSRVTFRKLRSKKAGHLLLLFSLTWQLAFFLCRPAHAATLFPANDTLALASSTASEMSRDCKFDKGPRAGKTYRSNLLVAVGSPCDDGAGSKGKIVPNMASTAMPPPMPRVTGTALLLHKETEEDGYGLYSYALMTHAPEEAELPRCRAFFKALIELPSASDLLDYLPKPRINITYLLLTSASPDWKGLSTSARVEYAISHYDYARSAAILASLPQPTGTGPVITSTLTPLSLDQHPHPVLVQDLSTAQPVLMADYVSKFVNQVAQDHFWQPNTLESFTLSLRNLLETAATGLGMSQDAVKSWIAYFK